MDTLLSLIRIAKSDLQAAKHLHQQKSFPQAYFCYQQASEKANKAYGLYSGEVTEKELFSEIRHDQMKIYKRITQAQANKLSEHQALVKPFEQITNHPIYSNTQIDEVQTKLAKAQGAFDNIRQIDLVNLTNDEVKDFIDQLNGVQKIYLPERTTAIDTELLTQINNFTDFIEAIGTPQAITGKQELSDYFTDDSNRDAFLNWIWGQALPFYFDQLFIHLTLFYSALLTIQHSSSTRYVTNNINPIDQYSANLPLVQKLPELLDLLEDATQRLENCYLGYTLNRSS